MPRFWLVAVAVMLLASMGSVGVGRSTTQAAPSRSAERGWGTIGPQRALSGVLLPGSVVHAQPGPPTPAPNAASQACAATRHKVEPQMAVSGQASRTEHPLREVAQPGADQVLVPDTSPWLGAPLPDPKHTPPPPQGDPRRLTLFRNTTVPVTTGNQIIPAEPSTDQLGRNIFATGNHHAEFSRDNGRIWQGLNPYAIFGPDFCCDQVTVADPQYHLQDWVLQYMPFFNNPGVVGNGHLVLATSPVGDFVNWRPYTIRPSDVGYANDQNNLDYNDLVVGSRYLYLTTRLITFLPDRDYRVNAVVLMRISRADLAAGRPAHYDAITRTDIIEELRVPQGITDIAYAGATSLRTGEGRVLRLLVWPKWSMWVTTVDRLVPPFRYMTPDKPRMKGDCSSRDQIVTNWCSELTSGGVFAARGGGYLWFSWAAQQYGARRPFPYVRITGIQEKDLHVAVSHDLYGLTVAHAYQAIAANAHGDLGLIDAYGGGTGTTDYFPGSMIAIFDNLKFKLASPTVDYFLTGKGNSCIDQPGVSFDGTWGDFLTIRHWHAGGDVWLATAFARKDNTPNICTEPVQLTIKNVVFGWKSDRRFYERAVRP
ncbi:hypothetical protein [Dictyobacter aurantiacus]|uniref:Uncharacterized protein n=1 Tax=Dictyobacter aurantiacus TaxID=1936993 RepID=A0A401ZJ01_9CHLR|nr:hypothetical protein [Dictyobacter aurantiacus]GCE06822.1 hypothetical protein KDAU_41510 [Dictyobacter aurantiacus]